MTLKGYTRKLYVAKKNKQKRILIEWAWLCCAAPCFRQPTSHINFRCSSIGTANLCAANFHSWNAHNKPVFNGLKIASICCGQTICKVSGWKAGLNGPTVDQSFPLFGKCAVAVVLAQTRKRRQNNDENGGISKLSLTSFPTEKPLFSERIFSNLDK